MRPARQRRRLAPAVDSTAGRQEQTARARLAHITNHLITTRDRPHPHPLHRAGVAGGAPTEDITATPLCAEFGLRVDGLSARACLGNPSLGRWLVDALHEHGALVISGQGGLVRDLDGYAAFAALFGRVHETPQPEPEPDKPPPPPWIVPGHRELVPIANVVGGRQALRWQGGQVRVDWGVAQPDTNHQPTNNNDNGMFHTDHVFLPTPGAATFLLPAQLPPHAGAEPQGLATELLSFGAARRHLPQQLADAIAGRTALHSYGPGILDEWMSLVSPHGSG